MLYLDSSVVLRAVLERGISPQEEESIGAARVLVTSRLALVEAARAFIRLRTEGTRTEAELADAEREVDSLWARCVILELTPTICDLACHIAPRGDLRTLDALHLASYLHARRRLGPELALLTVDRRLADAAAAG